MSTGREARQDDGADSFVKTSLSRVSSQDANSLSAIPRLRPHSPPSRAILLYETSTHGHAESTKHAPDGTASRSVSRSRQPPDATPKDRCGDRELLPPPPGTPIPFVSARATGGTAADEVSPPLVPLAAEALRRSLPLRSSARPKTARVPSSEPPVGSHASVAQEALPMGAGPAKDPRFFSVSFNMQHEGSISRTSINGCCLRVLCPHAKLGGQEQ